VAIAMDLDLSFLVTPAPRGGGGEMPGRSPTPSAVYR
jgi:hypothetical protein